jgi:hypothetical protein
VQVGMRSENWQKFLIGSNFFDFLIEIRGLIFGKKIIPRPPLKLRAADISGRKLFDAISTPKLESFARCLTTLTFRAKKSQLIRVGILNYGGGGGNRTRVRKSSTDSSTYLVLSFVLT